MVVTISETIHNHVYWLSFTERFNAWPQNPPSSNPLQLFLDYSEIVRTNDVNNPKFAAHIKGVKSGIRKSLPDGPARQSAIEAVELMGTHGHTRYAALLGDSGS